MKNLYTTLTFLENKKYTKSLEKTNKKGQMSS